MQKPHLNMKRVFTQMFFHAQWWHNRTVFTVMPIYYVLFTHDTQSWKTMYQKLSAESCAQPTENKMCADCNGKCSPCS